MVWKILPLAVSLSTMLVGTLALWNAAQSHLRGAAIGGLSLQTLRELYLCRESCMVL